MSILYTNKEIIDFSLIEEFSRNNIKYSRHIYKNQNLNDLEVLIEINGGKISIHKHKINKSNEWRLFSTLNLIQETINFYNLTLNLFCIINLNDGCPNDKVTRLTTVGRHKDSNHIGIPDSLSWQMICNNSYKNILENDIAFEDKKNKIIFRGSDTGKLRDDLSNQRLKFCHDNYDNYFVDAKVTNFCCEDSLLNELQIQKEKILSDRVSPSEQLKNKYLLYIYGHSVSTDRIIWNLASNSLVVQIEPKYEEYDYIWYNKFILDKGILPSIQEKDFNNNFNKFLQSNNIDEINSKQKAFGKLFLEKNIYLEYTKEVLIKYNEIYNL